MKITNIAKGIDEETFQPILKVALDVPIEVLVDGQAKLSEEEFAKTIGQEFLSQLKIYAKVKMSNPT
jgi:hypothetical protein